MKKNKQYQYKKYKKYFVKDNEGLSIIEMKYFDSINSWVEAFSIGVCCYIELQKVLTDDAITGEDSYIGNMKVTTGLERSLQELNERYPQLMVQIHSTSLLIHGTRAIKC